MKPFEPLGNSSIRRKASIVRKPLRTIAELAEELGIDKRRLGRLMSERGGPAPVFRHANPHTRTSTWYEPEAVRAWWKSIGVQP